MKFVTEPQLPGHLDELASAWDTSESMVMLPRVHPADPDWLSQVADCLPEDLQQGHFGLLTSGSTGTPKLVIGRKDRTAQLASRIHERQQLDEVRSTVLALPLSYSYAFVNQWLWARTHDTQLVFTRGLSDPVALFQALDTCQEPAMLCLVGSQLPLLKQALAPGRQFARVTRLNFAGGAFPQHALPWLSAVFPQARVFNNYGCTEALPRLCIREAGESQEASVVGRPLDGIELRTAEDGALEFRSRWGAVAMATSEGFHRIAPDEWLPTGDLAEQAGGGSWRLLGRSSELFKRFGEKISLPLLLATVRTAWHGNAAFYIDSRGSGETAHVLVLSPAPDAPALRNLLQAFRANFRRPHWPVRIESRASMPLLPNGKPDTQALALGEDHAIAWRQIG